MVVFHAVHAPEGYLSALAPRDFWLTSVFDTGYVSVSLFFILSGFILTYNYASSETSGVVQNRRGFWAARVARIYPVYLTGFLLAAPFALHTHLHLKSLFATLPSLSGRVFSFLTLTQAWTPSHALFWNGPSWSLSVEVFFYLLFPFILPWLWRLNEKQLLGVALLLWLAMLVPSGVLDSLGAHAGHGAAESSATLNFIKYSPVLRLPEFMIGIMLGKHFLGKPEPDSFFRFSSFASAVTALALLGMSPRLPTLMVHNGLLDPIFALLIYGLCKWNGLLAQFLSTSAVVFLGESSYALYLLHQPCMEWFNSIFKRLGMQPSYALFALYSLLTFAVSALVFVLIERPMRKRIVVWLSPGKEAVL